MLKKWHLIILSFFTLIGCDANVENNIEVDNPVNKNNIVALPKRDSIPVIKEIIIPEIELKLIADSLVNIQEIDTTIKIDLRYSTSDNFVGIDLYGDLNKVYMQPDVAKKIKQAQQFLKENDSTLSLLIFDAVRPLHIQQLMWDTLKMPINEKTKFLSNPKNHSVHNYGAAVDLSLINENGEELDMGTPYDYIGKKAYPRLEKHFLELGELTLDQIENRKLLRKVMRQAGFTTITTEWWHFNSCSRAQAKAKYKLVE